MVVAGYAIETPRLLLNSATDRFPDGLANSSGLVGKNLMAQSNQAVWGRLDEEVRSYKGPPSLAITEHWNYDDRDKDFFGGYAYMSQGPLPQLWANTLMSARGLWGQALVDAMKDYNHVVGLKIVGEMLPQESNRVTLADEVDQYGLRIPRVTYSWCDNDKRLIDHSLKFMRQALEAIDAKDIWTQDDDTCHLNGTARMGSDRATSVVDADCRSWDIPESLDLRRLGISDRRRRQSVAHDPGHRLPDRRPHSRARASGRAERYPTRPSSFREGPSCSTSFFMTAAASAPSRWCWRPATRR